MSNCKNICEKSSFYYPSNNLSTKQLQSRMIQTKQKITYNNSRMSTIYNTMLSLDYEKNRELLLRYKYNLYNRYLNILIRGNITRDKSLDLTQMLSTLLSNLTAAEYRIVFESVTPPVIEETFVDSGYTFYVMSRARSREGSHYFIVKNITRDFFLEPKYFYIFDLSDPSNLGTRLSFSEKENTNVPYHGISYVNLPGTEGAKLILNISVDAPFLYTFNDQISGISSYLSGYSTPYLRVHENNSIVSKVNNYSYINIRQYSNIAVYEDHGPRFSINDSLHPNVLQELNDNKYNVTYGTYYFDIPKTYACTLLNKGYEEYVTFIGDVEKSSLDTVVGTSLAPGDMEEGEYTFYYGTVKMTVNKPFPFDMSFYSRSFGFMGGMGLLHFVEPYIPVENGDIISLPYINTLLYGTTLRFNQDTTTNTKYGLSMGIYIVYIEQPVAFLNKGKEDIFSVVGTGIEGTSPDGQSCTFYTGQVKLYVKGFFDKLSICTQSGYSGGYKLLVYNAYYGAPSYTLSQSPKRLYPQNTMNLLTGAISFNNDYLLHRYQLRIGEYIVFQKHSAYPVTLLNKGKEQYILIESLQPGSSIQGIGPYGGDYTFYYGVMKIKVMGNFGSISIYYPGMNGGYPIFTYGNY
jgi:hypothetical protein